jgi:hypothetical protein
LDTPPKSWLRKMSLITPMTAHIQATIRKNTNIDQKISSKGIGFSSGV